MIVASEHNSNFDVLYNLVNGSIDNANIDAGAAIVDTKLAQLTTAGKVASSAVDGWKTGDWIISSVTTARTGWTNVSATHSNKFMRVNATPLSTGGADTHTLTVAELPLHGHPFRTTDDLQGNNAGGIVVGSDNTQTNRAAFTGTPTNTIGQQIGGTGSGTAHNNVPAFVQTVVFQRD